MKKTTRKLKFTRVGRLLLLFAGLTSLLTGTLGWASAKSDCESGQARSPLEIIASCTKVIHSGADTTTLLTAYSNRGISFALAKRWDACVSDMRKVDELNHANALNYFNRGYCYARGEEYVRAITEFTKELQVDSKNSVVLENRGYSYLKLDQIDPAIDDYTNAIRLNPQSREAFNNRGVGYSKKKQFRRAIEDYDRALQLDPRKTFEKGFYPEYGHVYENRGLSYAKLGELARALEDLNAALRLNPASDLAYHLRGEVHGAMGNYALAKADKDLSIALNPKNEEKGGSFGMYDFFQRDFDGAVAALVPTLKAKPEIYQTIFLFLARTRRAANAGKDTTKEATKEATKELEANAARLKSKDWPFAVIDLFLGKIEPQGLIERATTSDSRCESEYYIGQWYLIHGPSQQAEGYFQRAASTCPKTFNEYMGALEELKHLAK